MLPDRLNAKRCDFRCSETTSPMLLNSPEVVELNPRISWTEYSCLQNRSKSFYYDVQIAELFRVLATSLRVFKCTSNLEPCSPGVIIILFISNGTIQLTIFCTSWFRHCNINTQSSMYLNPHDYLQAIRFWFYLMQHYSLAPILQVQQLLRQAQYASYQSVSHPGWTSQHNQPNNGHLCTVFESPPHSLEVEDVVFIGGSSYTT
jgi:hypothetical protein